MIEHQIHITTNLPNGDERDSFVTSENIQYAFQQEKCAHPEWTSMVIVVTRMSQEPKS